MVHDPARHDLGVCVTEPTSLSCLLVAGTLWFVVRVKGRNRSTTLQQRLVVVRAEKGPVDNMSNYRARYIGERTHSTTRERPLDTRTGAVLRHLLVSRRLHDLPLGLILNVIETVRTLDGPHGVSRPEVELDSAARLHDVWVWDRRGGHRGGGTLGIDNLSNHVGPINCRLDVIGVADNAGSPRHLAIGVLGEMPKVGAQAVLDVEGVRMRVMGHSWIESGEVLVGMGGRVEERESALRV